MTDDRAELESLFILGAGRVGTALALALQRAGSPPLGLWTRSPESAARAERLTGRPCWLGPLPEAVGQAGVLILAVSDPATTPLAGALLDGGLLRSARVVLHCGGGRPAAKALAGLNPPIARGTLHPLLAVADPETGARRLAGAAVALEGDDPAREVGGAIARRLGANPLELPSEGLRLYHTAAVMASNHAVALWAAALDLLRQAGIAEGQGLPALLPLLASTLENVKELGIAGALTGPVRRADADRVADELEALEQSAPLLLPLFREATRIALRLARGAGEPSLEPGLRRIEELLEARSSVP